MKASPFLPCFASLALVLSAPGASFQWLGLTDGNWAESTNWDSPPASATDTTLVFDNATQLATNQNLPSAFALNALLLTANSGARTLAGSALIFDGPSPVLSLRNVVGSDPTNHTTLQLPLQLNQTLSITGGVDFTHQLILSSTAVISGTGGLTWAGGVGFLNAANTYSGPTLIAGGITGVNKTGAFGSSASVTIQSGAALQMQGGITLNKPLSLTGPGFGGQPALHASNSACSWSGAVTLAGAASLGAIDTGALSLTGPLALGANTLSFVTAANAASNSSVSGAISGSGGITKSGAGTLTFASPASGGHNYSGPTLIASGPAFVSTSAAFANSSVSVAANALLDLRPTVIVNRPLSLAGTLRGTTSTGFNNGSTWSGIVTLGGAAIYASTGSQPGNLTQLTVTGETRLNGNALTLAPGIDSANNTVQVSGPITGTGALNFAAGPGTSVLGLGASSNFTGPVTVGGRALLNGNGTLGAAANAVALTGGAAGVTISGTVGVQAWTIAGPGGISLGGNGTGVLNASVGGAGPVLVDSILTLGGNNTFTGGLVLSAALRFSSEANLGAAGEPITIQTGGSLFATASTTLSAARVLTINATNASLSAPAGVTLDIPGDVAGPGRLTLSGSSGGQFGGTIRLTGHNTQAGGTDIAGVTLEAASDASFGDPNGVLLIGRENGVNDIPGRLRALGHIEVAATRSTTFRLATVDTNGFDVTFHQPASGQDLTKQGAGVLRLNTANGFSGGVHNVSIEGGILRSGIHEALGRPRVTLSDASLDLNGFTQTVSTLNGPGFVQLGNGGVLTLIGGSTVEAIISGNGGVNFGQTPFSADSYRLLGANTFTGSVAITAGNRVTVKTLAGFGAAGNSVLLDNGGLEADSEAPGPVVIGASFPFTIGPGGASFGANGKSLVLETQLSGNAPLSVRGGGEGYEVRFANPNNNFVGNLTLGSASFGDAVLGIVANGSLGDAANVITLGYRFFDGETTRSGTGTLRAFADFTLPATRTIRLDGEPSAGACGGIFDTNGYTVAIQGGLSELRTGLRFEKRGEGTLVLQGANTFTGRTSVSAGTLSVGGSLAGGVEVRSGGRLSGTGVVGAVDVEGGGILAPGPGTLQTGALVFQSGAILALEFSSSSAGDQVAVTGNVRLDGDVELAPVLSYTITAPATFVVLAKDGLDPVDVNNGHFSFAGTPLLEGDSFTTGGATWTISYAGGSGNDVTLTATAAAPPPSLELTAFDIDPAGGSGGGGLVQGSVSGPPGAAVQIERSSDLQLWTPLTMVTLNGAGMATFDATDASAGAKAFYRLRGP